MANQTEIRERMTKQIIEALEKGVVPWRKPWSNLENTGFPMNVVSKKRYTGVNPLLLELAASRHGFRSKYWGTYRQWNQLGAQVKKRPDDVEPGEWGTRIVYWSPITSVRKNEDGEDVTVKFPLLREYTVFNADQVEGAQQFQPRMPSTEDFIDYEPAEKVIAATNADIRHFEGDKAAYFRPPGDYIVLPLKWQFLSGPSGLAAYYGTAFHELVHWSEHRLKWTGTYALGELRAEMGAAYVSTAVGIPTPSETARLDEHASYLGSWLAAMKADSKVIFQVASAASKAAEFILSFSEDSQAEALEVEETSTT